LKPRRPRLKRDLDEASLSFFTWKGHCHASSHDDLCLRAAHPGAQFIGCANRDEFALADHADLGTELFGLGQIVGVEKDGLSLNTSQSLDHDLRAILVRRLHSLSRRTDDAARETASLEFGLQRAKFESRVDTLVSMDRKDDHLTHSFRVARSNSVTSSRA
jgi:hypothetical protein